MNKKIDRKELRTRIDKERTDARSYAEEINRQRKRLMDLYRLAGPEVGAGQSRAVDSSVANTVDAMLPALMDTFCGDEAAIEAVSKTGDTEMAKQATSLIQHVINSEASCGWLTMQGLMRDALLAYNGVAQVSWDVEEGSRRQRIEGVTPEQIAMLEQTVELEDVTETGAVLVTPMREERCRIKLLPPECVWVSPTTRSADISSAPYVRVGQDATKAELEEMGYEDEDISGPDSEAETGYRAWDKPDGERYNYETHYLKFDGELLKVCTIDEKIVRVEEVNDSDLISVSAKPYPHEFYGGCPAEDAAEFQEVGTAVTRAMLDSLFLSVRPRLGVVDDGRISIEDLLNVVPGGVVRADSVEALAGGLREITVPFTGQAAMPVLAHLGAEKENRVGVTKYNQGLDADGTSKTAAGQNQLVTLANQRIKLAARSIAETGLRRMCRKILECFALNAKDDVVVAISGTPMRISPDVAKHEYEFMIDVGIGQSERAHRVALHQAMGAVQKEIVAAGGMGIGVTAQQMYENNIASFRAGGVRAPERYFTMPPPPAPPPPAPPPIELQLAQIQQQIKAADVAQKDRSDVLDAQTRVRIEEMDAQTKLQIEAMRMDHEREKDALKSQAAQREASLQCQLEEHKAAVAAGYVSPDGSPAPMVELARVLREQSGIMVEALKRTGGPRVAKLQFNNAGMPVAAVSEALPEVGA